MREFVIDAFDIDGLRKAADELRKTADDMERKGVEICRRLAEIGLRVASINYAGGFMDGNDDVDVTIEPIEHGYKIVASGEDVYFVEFGTGVAAGNGYDTSVINPPVDISPGSWSETHRQQFSKKGYWYYNGKKYEMTTPRMGMYHAAKEIEQNLKRIAEEVLNSD